MDTDRVTFTLTRDGRQVREFLRTSSRAERVAQVCDGEPLTPCEGTRGPLRIEAYLSRPEQARSGAGGLRLFVNGRSVRDRALAVTIAQAYGSVLDLTQNPAAAVPVVTGGPQYALFIPGKDPGRT